MPNTMTLINAVTVGAGGAASIDFTSIPSTYTDLCLLFSTRSSRSADSDAIFLRVNNDTGTSHSYRFVRGNGSAVDSNSNSTASFVYVGQGTAGNNTASTFQNGSVYITNYAESTNKSMSVDSVGENNATATFSVLDAGLWSSSSTITALKLYLEVGPNFVQHSTAYLYGIVKQ